MTDVDRDRACRNDACIGCGQGRARLGDGHQRWPRDLAARARRSPIDRSSPRATFRDDTRSWSGPRCRPTVLASSISASRRAGAYRIFGCHRSRGHAAARHRTLEERRVRGRLVTRWQLVRLPRHRGIAWRTLKKVSTTGLAEPQTLFAQPEGGNWLPAWSPDGEWILYLNRGVLLSTDGKSTRALGVENSACAFSVDRCSVVLLSPAAERRPPSARRDGLRRQRRA